MSKQEPSGHRRLSNSNLPLILGGLALFLIVVLGTFWFYGKQKIPADTVTATQHSPDTQLPAKPLSTQSKSESSISPQDTTQKVSVSGSSDIAQSPDSSETIEKKSGSNITMDPEAQHTDTPDSTVPSGTTLNQDMENKISACEASSGIVKQFYSHLDEQEYLIPLMPEVKSEPYFTELIQKLADNPPVVSRETDDLFTILKNTAHFFRVIGKENIVILKAILDREKEQFENVLSHFYKLTLEGGCAEEQFGLQLTKDTVYDYAGFFLNTMGGRLYLFRRDSVSRLAVSYYSIMIIEQANREGRNVYGLDIGPAIKLLVPEIENSGSHLRMRDEYLEDLYELENRLN